MEGAGSFPKVVTIGGGSGGFTVLRGLREYPLDLTAICTVFDSGGSTGVLRDEYGALPQGDVRRCLLALIPESDADWRRLLMHRFERNGGNVSGLSDHSLGNLMLLGAEREWGRLGGIARMARLLHVQGRVLPVSVDTAHLMAALSDGTEVRTESAIDTRNVLSDERSISRVWLDAPVTACREAIDAIRHADVILIGPGDLYTSIIPNLLVRGIPEAINDSPAHLVYIANIMTKGAETRGYGVADFVRQLQAYGISRRIDEVIVSASAIAEGIAKTYWDAERAEPVRLDPAERPELDALAGHVIEADVLSRTGLRQGLVRHSSKRLARAVMDIVEAGQR